jgi:hypothetical protein
LIESVSSYSDVGLIVDHLLDKLGAKSSSDGEEPEEDSRKEEIVFLINEIVQGRT